MPTAFVTGGSGFIGRNLIAYLKQAGYTVRALGRSAAALATVQQAGAEPVMGELTDRATLEQGLRGCDVVFHAAASTAIWDLTDAAYQANVVGTEHLLAAARAAGVGRFVLVGTEAVLLDASGQALVNVDETYPRAKNPAGVYPATKGQAEERVLAANAPGFATMSVRPRMVWGKDDTSLLRGIVEITKAGQWQWIGGGKHLTSTTHITNTCEGLVLAAERGKGGEIYFLSDGAPIEFRTFITAMLKTQNLDPGSRAVPFGMAWFLANLCEGIWRTLRLKSMPPIHRTLVMLAGVETTVNDAKARRELGYVGKVTREAGLAEMTKAST